MARRSSARRRAHAPSPSPPPLSSGSNVPHRKTSDPGTYAPRNPGKPSPREQARRVPAETTTSYTGDNTTKDDAHARKVARLQDEIGTLKQQKRSYGDAFADQAPDRHSLEVKKMSSNERALYIARLELQVGRRDHQLEEEEAEKGVLVKEKSVWEAEKTALATELAEEKRKVAGMEENEALINRHRDLLTEQVAGLTYVCHVQTENEQGGIDDGAIREGEGEIEDEDEEPRVFLRPTPVQWFGWCKKLLFKKKALTEQSQEKEAAWANEKAEYERRLADAEQQAVEADIESARLREQVQRYEGNRRRH